MSWTPAEDRVVRRKKGLMVTQIDAAPVSEIVEKSNNKFVVALLKHINETSTDTFKVR